MSADARAVRRHIGQHRTSGMHSGWNLCGHDHGATHGCNGSVSSSRQMAQTSVVVVPITNEEKAMLFCNMDSLKDEAYEC